MNNHICGYIYVVDWYDTGFIFESIAIPLDVKLKISSDIKGKKSNQK